MSQMWGNGKTQRKQRHDVRRETIVQQAALCFNRKGYHGTTIDDIARELKVSKAALYYYVKNKEEILFRCHEMSLDMALEGLRRAEQLPLPADEKLRIALQHYIEAMTDRLKACVVLLEEGMLSRSLHRRIVRRRDEYERALRLLVSDGVASGVFVECDPRMAVFVILGAVNWIPKWYRPEGALPGKTIAEMVAGQLVRALQRSPANTDLAAHRETSELYDRASQ